MHAGRQADSGRAPYMFNVYEFFVMDGDFAGAVNSSSPTAVGEVFVDISFSLLVF